MMSRKEDNTGKPTVAAYRPPGSRSGGSSWSLAKKPNTAGSSVVNSAHPHIVKLQALLLDYHVDKDLDVESILQQISRSTISSHQQAAVAQEVHNTLAILVTPHRASIISKQTLENMFRFVSFASATWNFRVTDDLAQGLTSMALRYLLSNRPSSIETVNSVEYLPGCMSALKALSSVLKDNMSSRNCGIWVIKIALLFSNLRPAASSDELDVLILDVQIEISRVISRVLTGMMPVAGDGNSSSTSALAATGHVSGSSFTTPDKAAAPKVVNDEDPIKQFFSTGHKPVLSSTAKVHVEGIVDAVLYNIQSDFGGSSTDTVTGAVDATLPVSRLQEIIDNVMMRCADAMVKNLHSAVHLFTKAVMRPRPEGSVDPNLAKMLEWLCVICAAVRTGVTYDKHNAAVFLTNENNSEEYHDTMHAMTLVFTPHLPSLIIALRTVFQRIVPAFLADIEAIKNVGSGHKSNSSTNPGDVSDNEVSYYYSQVGFVCVSLGLLGAVASTNPAEFLRSWPIFLTDPGIVDNNLAAYLQYIAPLDQDRHQDLTSARRKNATVVAPPQFQCVFYRALILGLAGYYDGASQSFGNATRNNNLNKFRYGTSMVRSAASQALRCLVVGLPMKRWFAYMTAQTAGNLNLSGGTSGAGSMNQSQKTVDALIKIIDAVHLAMLQEDDEVTLSNHFEVIRVMLPQLPLATMYHMDERSIVRPGAPIVSSLLERSVTRVLISILKMSLLEGRVPSILNKPVSDDASMVPLVGAPPEAIPADCEEDVMSNKALVILIQQLEPSATPCHNTEKFSIAMNEAVSEIFSAVTTAAPTSLNAGDTRGRGVKHRSMLAVIFLTELASDISTPLASLSNAVRYQETGSDSLRSSTYAHRLLFLCAGICGLTPVQKGPPDAATSYALALKTLIISFLQSLGSQFTSAADDDMSTFLRLICISPSVNLRMLANQCVGIILSACKIVKSEKSSTDSICSPFASPSCDVDKMQEFIWNIYKPPNVTFSVSAATNPEATTNIPHPKFHTLSCLDVLSFIEILQKGCEDCDHLVRGHAASSIGLLGANCWMACKPVSADAPEVGSDALLKLLLTLCEDAVGTVRTLAYKSLGEAVLAGGLHDSGDDASAEDRLVENILVRLRSGCVDSKLSVRMQALWSLGNLLLVLLPYRLVDASSSLTGVLCSHHFPSYQANDQLISGSEQRIWAHIDIWRTLSELCVGVLKDSDKMLSSMTRCLGLLSAGVTADPTTCAHLMNVLIHEVLLERSTQVFPTGLAILPSLADLTSAVTGRTQKLLMALSSGLGVIGWTLIPLVAADAPDTTEAGALRRQSMVSIIRCITVVLCHIMKLAGDNVRLQAARGLVAMAHALCNCPDTYFPEDIYGPDAETMILETILIGMSQVKSSKQVKRTKSSKKSSAKSASADSGSPDIKSSPVGRRVIITKPAPLVRGGSYMAKRVQGIAYNNSGMRRDLPVVPADVEATVGGAKGASVSKIFKPLPSAFNNAITVRRRPVAQDVERNLLRMYLILLWTLTSNRSGTSIPDASVVGKAAIGRSDAARQREQEVFMSHMETTVDKLEVLMEDNAPVVDSLFELNQSPLLASPSVIRQRMFKGYTVAPNTLAADCARHYLQLLTTMSSSSTTEMSALDVAMERLSWLAAADVKYFIIPGINGNASPEDKAGNSSAAANGEGSKLETELGPAVDVVLIHSSDINEAYLYDEDEI